MDKKLSHTDDTGSARMVDVGHKPIQQRTATAIGFIRMQHATLELVRKNVIKKGDVLTVAEIAGIQAAKLTPSLIPLCHPLPLTSVQVKTSIKAEGVEVRAECRCTGQTGIEMEALTAVSVALLTIYDMCKAVDKFMIIEGITLTDKSKKDISISGNIKSDESSMNQGAQ
ncbi:MAG: cyclic pyranopterin monophosphate synthase MoaC [Bacteroidales bacterium]